jgi:hypothetical protein
MPVNFTNVSRHLKAQEADRSVQSFYVRCFEGYEGKSTPQDFLDQKEEIANIGFSILCLKNKVELIKLVYEKVKVLNIEGINRALELVCTEGSIEVAEYLIDECKAKYIQGDINCLDLALWENLTVASYLIKRGAYSSSDDVETSDLSDNDKDIYTKWLKYKKCVEEGDLFHIGDMKRLKDNYNPSPFWYLSTLKMNKTVTEELKKKANMIDRNLFVVYTKMIMIDKQHPAPGLSEWSGKELDSIVYFALRNNVSLKNIQLIFGKNLSQSKEYLFYALEHGASLEIVKLFVNEDTVHMLDEKGNSVLGAACKKCDIHVVNYFASRWKLSTKHRNLNGDTLFHIAGRSNSEDLCFFIIYNYQLDLNIKNKEDVKAYWHGYK